MFVFKTYCVRIAATPIATVRFYRVVFCQFISLSIIFTCILSSFLPHSHAIQSRGNRGRL